MSKKLLRYLCFSVFIILAACAPRPTVAPPPSYDETEMTLKEVLAKAGKDIKVLKAITDIRIEKNNEPYSFIKASVLIKEPQWIHMRIYQLGMLVRDFVIRDNELYVLSGKNDSNLMTLGRELYNAIFWWDAYSSGVMHREDETYVIRTDDKEIYLDRSTLLPLRQEIKALNKNIRITYENPVNNDDFWYSEILKINVADFTFTVKLKKLIRNPSLGEFDFQIPAGS